MYLTTYDPESLASVGSFWNPLTWGEGVKVNFTWDQVKAAGFTDAQIDTYLRATGLERWAAEQNITLSGMILRLQTYFSSGTTTPTGTVQTRVSEESPSQVASRVFKEGVMKDLGEYGKYAKYAAYGIGILVALRVVKLI